MSIGRRDRGDLGLGKLQDRNLENQLVKIEEYESLSLRRIEAVRKVTSTVLDFALDFVDKSKKLIGHALLFLLAIAEIIRLWPHLFPHR